MRRLALFSAFAVLAAACSSGGTSATMPLVEGGGQGGGSSAGSVSTTSATAVTTTTVTTATTSATTTTASPTVSGTREDPLPAGTGVDVGDWTVTVLGATRDATDVVLAENQFNDPPVDGAQFMIVTVATTYLGEGAETPFAGLTFTSVGNGAVAYDYDDGCGVVPDDYPGFKEAFPGGTLVGNLCWEVSPADAGSLVLIAEPAFTIDADRYFLEIPADGTAFDPPPSGGLVPDGGSKGSRANPIDAGKGALVGAWEITVVASVPDATDLVLAENQFNDPPAAGRQFLMVEVQATNRGIESEPPFETLTFAAVGATAVAYDYDDTCGVIPDPFPALDEVFSGGAVTGHLCWSVTGGDTADLVMYVTETFSPDAQRVFFELP